MQELRDKSIIETRVLIDDSNRPSSSARSSMTINPLRVLVKASRLWWREWIGMILLNILWLLLQVPLVTGPPATAVLFVIARKVHEDEVWEMPELWTEMRRLFWPAWRWALPNLLLGGMLVWNLYAFQAAAGGVWIALRFSWGVGLVLWLLLNFLYWPFWLAQADPSSMTTYANCGRFLLRHPGAGLLLGGTAVAVLLLSLRWVLPLSAGVVCWLALIGVTAVSQTLTQERNEAS